MRQTLACLVQLQKVDSQIHEIEKSRDQYPAKLKEIEVLSKKQDKVYQLRNSQLEEIKQERTAKDELLKSELSKLKKWEKRLMESKNSREAAPLAREIDAQKRLNEEAQEEILRLMEDEERLGKDVEGLLSNLNKTRKSYKETEKICSQKLKEHESKLSGFEKAREQYTSQLQRGILRKYNSVKSRRAGLAIVPVREGCCVGCNMRLPPQLYNIIQKVESLDICPGCKRILYWEKGLENEPS